GQRAKVEGQRSKGKGTGRGKCAVHSRAMWLHLRYCAGQDVDFSMNPPASRLLMSTPWLLRRPARESTSDRSGLPAMSFGSFAPSSTKRASSGLRNNWWERPDQLAQIEKRRRPARRGGSSFVTTRSPCAVPGNRCAG